MEAADEALARAIAAIAREHHPSRDGGDAAAIDAAIDAAMPTLLAADPNDHEDSLSRADLYRIRAAKLIARLLPAGALADRGVRRRIRAAVREAVREHLGGELPESRYLDRRES
ncbi:MAG: hypothetical protein R3A79_29145 [Nannocystaceae bacterium]